MIRTIAFLDRHAGLILLGAILTMLTVLLTGCGDVRVDPNPGGDLLDKLEQATKAKVASDARAESAIKTSKDAQQAAQDARSEAAAAQDLAREKTALADRLDARAQALVIAETAQRIALASWWLFFVGLVVGLVGLFLCLRFPSKTSLCIAIFGAGSLILGLFGVWLAPHWIAAAWGVGIAVLGALALGIIYIIHRFHGALHALWDKTQDEAKADPRLAKVLRVAGVRL